MIHKKVKVILLHIVGWLLFLFIPIFFSMGKAIRFDRVLENNHDLQNLLSWVLLIVFSYVNHLYLVPKFYLGKKYVPYGTWVFICFISILALPELTDLFWNHPPPSSSVGLSPPYKPNEMMEISHFILFYVVSVLFSISYQTQLQLKESEKQRLQSELDNLKAQIQPHFLFNTLNSIYSLAIRKDDKTADTVVQLSNFLRYVIKDAKGHSVSLEKEIDYLSNYIDLQKSRLRDSILLDFIIVGGTKGQQIAPLILFSLIENAFRYGVNPEEESVIKIRLEIMEERMKLDVYNKKVNTNSLSGTGIGMANTQKRLDILYPERHSLQIIETEEDFKVELMIEL